jgi:predicted secreted Zn-dependent protease
MGSSSQLESNEPAPGASKIRSHSVGLAVATGAAIFFSLYTKPIPLMPPRFESGSSSAPTTGAAQSSFESLITDIPNVTISYYDITATDVAGIRSEMTAKGPVIRGKHFDGQTRWNYRWYWPGARDGRCNVAHARAVFEAYVRLPRLTHAGSLSPDVLHVWQAYSSALSRHEAQHVRDAYDGRSLVGNAVRASTCATANMAGQSAIEELERQADEYDRLTNHGAEDGAVFPPRSIKPRFGILAALLAALAGSYASVRLSARRRGARLAP